MKNKKAKSPITHNVMMVWQMPTANIFENMKRLIQRIRRVFAIPCVSKSLPDHYAGELNTKRIKAYRLLHEQYNLEEGTVRDIFCKGADWYKEQCQKGNVC